MNQRRDDHQPLRGSDNVGGSRHQRERGAFHERGRLANPLRMGTAAGARGLVFKGLGNEEYVFGVGRELDEYRAE